MQAQTRIIKLDDHLINQIAAGEVVERPASALKEIIENSIDANATEISIDLENGGKTLIRVLDNGDGLSEENLPLVFERHATSKIQSLTDLENNLHLGFRGEALAAISSVSKIEFASRHKDAEHGFAIDSDGQLSSKSMNQGTVVTVRDLFFNTVARQKYMKTDATEYKNCIQTIESYILAHPQIAFRVTHNHKLIYKLAAQSPIQRITEVLGNDLSEQLIPVSYFGEQIKLNGYICRPQAAVSKLPTQMIFVNKRPINARNFNHAITQSYGSWIFGSEKPQFVLYLDIAPQTVDMNIHPRKLEAKFFLESKIYGVLRQVTRQTLEKHSLTPSVSKSESLAKFVPGMASEQTASQGISDSHAHQTPPALNRDYQSNKSDFTHADSQASLEAKANLQNPMGQFGGPQPSGQNFEKFLFQKPKSHTHVSSSSSHESYQPITQPALQAQSDINQERQHSSLENKSESNLKAIAQVKNSYILAEGPEDIFIVDQHAAHERVWYEILKQNAQSQTPKSQPLLVSETIQLSKVHLQTLIDCESVLESLGFSFTIKDSHMVINAIPHKLNKINLPELIENILEDLTQNNQFTNLNELEDIVINFTACRTAIKFGQKLSLIEMQQLLDDMEAIQHKKYTCPHGRPAIITLGMKDLEKLFKRIH